MHIRYKILVINGSASARSSNQQLIDIIAQLTKNYFELTVFNRLKALPHFDPDHAIRDTPKAIAAFREAIKNADGILICTPEYIFSIPSGLKNAFEWCVSTTIFSDKPTGLIVASADGRKGQKELELIMKTLMAHFTAETTLLIAGVKGKLDDQGELHDAQTKDDLNQFIEAFKLLIKTTTR